MLWLRQEELQRLILAHLIACGTAARLSVTVTYDYFCECLDKPWIGLD